MVQTKTLHNACKKKHGTGDMHAQENRKRTTGLSRNYDTDQFQFGRWTTSS